MELNLRKTYRTQLTKLITSAKEIIKNDNVENANESDVNALIARIKDAQVNLISLNDRLASTFKEETLEDECLKFIEYNDNAVDILARLETLKLKVSDKGIKSNSNKSNHLVTNMQVKLPKLELIKFGGDIEAWPAFWEQFSSTIHNNASLNDAAKYTYLKNVLYGRAANTISGLTSGQCSYNDAVELLKEEYAHSERIIDSYIQRLLAMSPVKNDRDVQGLRKIYNTALAITRSLVNLGISPDQYGLMVNSILLKVLPINMRIHFNRTKINSKVINEFSGSENAASQDDNVSVSTTSDYSKEINRLLQFIKTEIDALSLANGVVVNDERNKLLKNKTFNNRGNNNNENYTAAGLFTKVSENCLFCCSKSHSITDCDSTKSVNEKKEILKKNSRCFKCLKSGHVSKFCRDRNIKCSKCNGRHASTMCDPNYKKTNTKFAIANNSNVISNKNMSTEQIADSNSTSKSAANLFTNGYLNNVYLKTAKAVIESNNDEGNLLIRIVIDGGSQLTYIKENVSRKLNLPVIGTHKISILPFGSTDRTPAKLYNKVLVNFRGINNEKIKISAIEVPEICLDCLRPPSLHDAVIQNFALTHYLSDNSNEDVTDGITVLIGADNYWKLITGETKQLSESLTAVNSKLGWTLHGVSNNNDINEFYSTLNVFVTHAHDSEEPFDLKAFWELETIGINSPEKAEDNFTDNFIKNNITFKDNRYEVSLPWNSDKELDSNFKNAQIRLKKLVFKLYNEGKLMEYDNVIQEFIKNDFAEKTDQHSTSKRIYYLPHRPVYREDKETTKVRAVFDASSSATGLLSLNSMLYSGDNLVPNIINILLAFRFGKYALIADLEKAFLQISIAEKDRDSLRFLWFQEGFYKELKSKEELPPTQTYRMTRVTFGVTTSPFLLAATLRKHLKDQTEPLKETAEKLLKHFYVDDLVLSVNTFEEANEIYLNSCQILKAANMNLRKWYSNDSDLMKLFNNEIPDSNNANLKKVLGLLWFVVSDELMVDVNSVITYSHPHLLTKRNVLQMISRIFDPLGILGPFTIRAKILMQEIWKRNLDWDEIIPPDLITLWMQWSSELSILSTYTVPRCVLLNTNNEIELHIFADASPLAYGAAAYVKCMVSNEVHLLFTKNRISPINKNENKTLTLPKLELTAAVCACRLGKFIIDNISLNFRNTFMWSDSKITLHWIRGEASRWKPYVKNRVIELQTSALSNWNYCPGKENPADLLTRGVSAAIMKESELWLHGPEWLQGDKEYWPSAEFNDFANEEEVINLLLPVTECSRNSLPIFPLSKYSNLDKALRITAYIKRFTHNARSQNKERGALTVNELNEAEIYWIHVTQRSEYFKEIESLIKTGNVYHQSSILSLNPILDENQTLRLGGRLDEALLPYDTRHPVILPKNSNFTEKIIWRAHEQASHFGVNATLAITRNKYWIVKGRQKIKSLIGTCLKCKRLKSKPGREIFAPLPRNRITEVRPFKIIGVDFAGPLYVKCDHNSKRKVYIMLLTCAVIRAVHLELVPNLTTEGCIRGLRRFIARRGVPEIIYSDNAKTFKRSSAELSKLFSELQSKPVQDLARAYRIEWKFIVERAAWWGGFWERLVRTVKDALKITLGKASVDEDELRTILAEVEATVNSRPITYIDDDPDNLAILSPSKFLIGEGDIGFPMDAGTSSSNRDSMLLLWKQRERLIARFWKRWKTDYLQQLRSAHHLKPSDSSKFSVGGVVIIQEKNLPRLSWKLARVIKLLQGRDGKVRACEVETANKLRLRRPIQLLHPMEIEDPMHPRGEDVENTR